MIRNSHKWVFSCKHLMFVSPETTPDHLLLWAGLQLTAARVKNKATWLLTACYWSRGPDVTKRFVPSHCAHGCWFEPLSSTRILNLLKLKSTNFQQNLIFVINILNKMDQIWIFDDLMWVSVSPDPRCVSRTTTSQKVRPATLHTCSWDLSVNRPINVTSWPLTYGSCKHMQSHDA